MTNHSKIREYYLADIEETLFPMETCRFIVENAGEEISKYIESIKDPELRDFCFLPQETVYAAKTSHHQRRTIKLDPVAEYYLYEMTYVHRAIFRKSISTSRASFGYRFSEGSPISIHDSYQEFSAKALEYKDKYQYFIKFDISAYFNSIYHHDMANWFSSKNLPKSDSDLFGQFMREINSGFSIDFMPHGLYPSKMLGSHFLSYIDHSSLIKCEQMIRFMDDFIIFSDSKDTLIKDFQTIQKSLGQKSLNLNTEKTVLFSEKETSIYSEVNEIKEQIKEKVYLGNGSGMEFEIYDEVVRHLSNDEVQYLLQLLEDDQATDLEASLILDCIEKHSEEFYKHIPHFIYRYPHLSKKIYRKCAEIIEYDELSVELKKLLESDEYLNEYQLFWIACIVEKYLLDSCAAGQLLALMYEHKNATNISKAKILEIPDHRFGMPEWREIHLKNGSSGWLAWASAVGMRNDNKQTKNYLMGYFSKASPINKLIGDCVNSI